MTTEDRVMTILERANPVPTDEFVDVSVGARRYLDTARQQRSTPMTMIAPTPNKRRSAWPAAAIAASVIALVVAITALVVSNRNDAVVVNTPEPVPTTVPAPAPTSTVDAQAAVEAFFGAYNAGQTDAVLDLMSQNAVVTTQYGFGPPDPEQEPFSAADIDLSFAWNHAQGEVWTEPTCDLADEQRPAGTTLSCQWDTLDAVVLAVDGEPIPTQALIVVANGKIAELHRGYSRPDFATLGTFFNVWMEISHPDVEGADCCAGDTREESVQRGKLHAQWANEWATFLDTYGCTASGSCRVSIEEWVAEYDAQCLALDPPDIPTSELVDHMRGVPLPSPDKTSRDALVEADTALLDPGNAVGRIAELQQTRLEVMTQLGIDPACHPTPG